MERVDKIFTILCGLGLVVLLVWQRGSSASPLVNASAMPSLICDSGPAYLLSALPRHRGIDDYAAPVSYSERDAF